jgi:hypothetical protein
MMTCYETGRRDDSTHEHISRREFQGGELIGLKGMSLIVEAGIEVSDCHL